MQSCFDITNPDASYDWLYSVLNIEKGNLVSDYRLECNSDFDIFAEKHFSEIESMDIDRLELVVFHVTTNGDGCAEIKKNGLKDLQKVLQEETELSMFLKERGIWFDIPSKTMHVGGKDFDIDHKKYTNWDRMIKQVDALYNIGRKIFYDHQVNGFLFSRDIYDYGTIHNAPEFLLTLSEFGKVTVRVDDAWEAVTKPYVVKYKARIADFEYYTFYGDQEEYLEDHKNKWIGLKKLLFQKAVDSAFSDLSSDIYAYMKPGRVIEPERIIDCIPAEKWQASISKYYGRM